jgi:hypothetical protein
MDKVRLLGTQDVLFEKVLVHQDSKLKIQRLLHAPRLLILHNKNHPHTLRPRKLCNFIKVHIK